MIDIETLTQSNPAFVPALIVAVGLLVMIVTVLVGIHYNSAIVGVGAGLGSTVVAVALGTGLYVWSGIGEGLGEAQAEAEKVLVEAVEDRYEADEVRPTQDRSWGDTAVQAVEEDSQTAPHVEVLTDAGVEATYKLLFDNKTGEATLIADDAGAPSPKELLRTN